MVLWFVCTRLVKKGPWSTFFTLVLKRKVDGKKYLPVLFEKSDIYKSKYSIKPLLNQEMMHFIPTLMSAATLQVYYKFTHLTELKCSFPLYLTVYIINLKYTWKTLKANFFYFFLWRQVPGLHAGIDQILSVSVTLYPVDQCEYSAVSCRNLDRSVTVSFGSLIILILDTLSRCMSLRSGHRIWSWSWSWLNTVVLPTGLSLVLGVKSWQSDWSIWKQKNQQWCIYWNSFFHDIFSIIFFVYSYHSLTVCISVDLYALTTHGQLGILQSHILYFLPITKVPWIRPRSKYADWLYMLDIQSF